MKKISWLRILRCLLKNHENKDIFNAISTLFLWGLFTTDDNLLVTIHLQEERGKKWVKLKCNLVKALRFCIGRTAHKGSRSIDLHFLDHINRRRRLFSVTPRPLFNPGKEPVPILQESEWAPEPGWTGAENLVTTRIRSPVRPARSQSLYRLRYPENKRVKSFKYLLILWFY
jgi:hypothetical protein